MIDLIYGDCLEKMKDIPDGSVDMVLVDPPYGTSHNGTDWDKKLPMSKTWEQYKRIVKENGAILVFTQMPFGAELIMSNEKMFRYEIIWQKHRGTGYLNANRMPLRAHENILVFYKKLPTYNPQKTPGKPYVIKQGANRGAMYDGHMRTYTLNNTGDRYPLDIIKFPNNNAGKQSYHPTQKPVPLLEYLIKTYTNPGEVVLDNCMGSGSTGVACINTGRSFIGIEKDEHYFEIAKKRIEEAENALDPAS